MFFLSFFLSFKASFSPFHKTQRTFDGLNPRVAQMKSLAVHLVPFLLLSLCTLTIGAFIQLLRRFGLTISMEEIVSRAAYILKKCCRSEQYLLQTISHSIKRLIAYVHYRNKRFCDVQNIYHISYIGIIYRYHRHHIYVVTYI